MKKLLILSPALGGYLALLNEIFQSPFEVYQVSSEPVLSKCAQDNFDFIIVSPEDVFIKLGFDREKFVSFLKDHYDTSKIIIYSSAEMEFCKEEFNLEMGVHYHEFFCLHSYYGSEFYKSPDQLILHLVNY